MSISIDPTKSMAVNNDSNKVVAEAKTKNIELFTQDVKSENIPKEKIEKLIQKKESELKKLTERLEYLQEKPEALEKQAEKEHKISKACGIGGSVAGGIGMGALVLGGTSLIADAGIAIAIGVACPAALVIGALVGAVGALAAEKICESKRDKDFENKDAEIAELQMSIQNLTKEINDLKMNL